ncbi:MAG: plastocyanin/azurin family copper-binding protein [Chloroflexota bacterium]|nr:plastocyanin/azurin family copper-binding protein [Chloroflexota bacterium]
MAARSPAAEMPAFRVWSAALALLLLAGLAVGCTEAAPRRVEIRIHYSHFDPVALRVPRGVAVTFVLINEDPIDHEWLIGDAAFHERHRHGTEAQHGARPNEVTIPALSTIETTLTFDTAGTQQYICHVPQHEAYGMIGTLTVT